MESNPTATTSTGKEKGKALKRREGHASRACNECRRRRTRCTEGEPCQACENSGESCVYTREVDGRKPVSKSYVDALELRVAVLQALLKRNGISEAGAETVAESLTERDSGDSQGGPSASKRRATLNGVSPPTKESGSEDDQHSPDLPVERLKLDDDTGELRFYGPTSAFRHLPEPPSASQPSPTSTPASPQSFPSSSNTLFGSLSSDIQTAGSPSAGNISAEPTRPIGEIDWGRNLPEIPGGLDEDLHDLLLELFFTYFCSWCCWTDPVLFRRDLAVCCSDHPSTRTSFYSPLLHNAVLSLAATFSDDARITENDAGAIFATKAKALIEDEAERPMLSTVQGLMLLGSYHSGSAKHGLGWLYSGMGLRMSTTLGLGVDCSPWKKRGLISDVLQDQRDRTFWCCFVQDKLWSLYVGRSASITESSFETPLPLARPELDSVLWKPVNAGFERPSDNSQSGASNPLAPSVFDFNHASKAQRMEGAPNQITLNFEWTCRLALLAQKIMKTCYGLRSDIFSTKAQALVSDLHLQLEKWQSDLPTQLQIGAHIVLPPPPHVIMLHCMYWFMSILLHRPFYRRQNNRVNTEVNDLAVKRCDRAATKIVTLFDLFRRSPGLRYAPISLTQMTFTAGTIHLLTAVSGDTIRAPKRASVALEGAKACVQALDEMGFKCATQSCGILSRLISEWSPKPLPSTVPPGVAPPNTTLVHEALDPNSDIAKQLLALGWTPPTQSTQRTDLPALYHVPNIFSTPGVQDPLLSSSEISTQGQQQDQGYSPFVPLFSPFQSSAYFAPQTEVTPMDPQLVDLSIPAANPYSDEGMQALFLGGGFQSWNSLPPLESGWAFAPSQDDQWRDGFSMDM